MLYLFLFHIDRTIYACHVFIKTTIFNKRYRIHKIKSDLDTFSSERIFVKNIYM